MRAKKGLIIQMIDDAYYLIDSGEEDPKFNGMVKLNETSHFIIKNLMEKELNLNDLYDLFLNNYSVSKKELEESVPNVIEQLKNINIIKE